MSLPVPPDQRQLSHPTASADCPWQGKHMCSLEVCCHKRPHATLFAVKTRFTRSKKPPQPAFFAARCPLQPAWSSQPDRWSDGSERCSGAWAAKRDGSSIAQAGRVLDRASKVASGTGLRAAQQSRKRDRSSGREAASAKPRCLRHPKTRPVQSACGARRPVPLAHSLHACEAILAFAG